VKCQGRVDYYGISCTEELGCPTELALFFDPESSGSVYSCLFAARSLEGWNNAPAGFKLENMDTYTSPLTTTTDLIEFDGISYNATAPSGTALCSAEITCAAIDQAPGKSCPTSIPVAKIMREFGRPYTAQEKVPTLQSKNALVFSSASVGQNMIPYMPWRSRMSPFWNRQWLSWDITNNNGERIKGLDTTDPLHFLSQPIGEWSINGPGDQDYVEGKSNKCFCNNGGDCQTSPFGYNNVGGQVKNGQGAWDANSPEELQAWENFDVSFGNDNQFDWVEGALPGDKYIQFGAHSKQEQLPTLKDLGCSETGEESYKQPRNPSSQTYNFETKEFYASTTPMPCDTSTSDYTTGHKPRQPDNTDGDALSMTDDSGVIHNWGFIMTNNPFTRLYQSNSRGDFCTDESPCLNIASREMQREALSHSQGAYFISIIVVQWADLLICKTRRLSIVTQGMSNTFMNFGLMFETLLGAYMCYMPGLDYLGTRPLRFSHWMCAIPFSMAIFLYDETRKYLMRATTVVNYDKLTGAIISEPGWIERNTYY